MVLLGLWFLDIHVQVLGERAETGLSRGEVVLLVGYSGVALVAVVVVASLAWRPALLDWDTSQIDRLEHVGCPVATLEAVDNLFGAHLSTANTLLGLGAIGALIATVFLFMRLTRRLHQRRSNG